MSVPPAVWNLDDFREWIDEECETEGPQDPAYPER